MEVRTAKSVRFSEIVKQCGAPHLRTIWGAPEDDPELKKAIKQDRVLTVQQNNVGSKADLGIVGFRPEKNASYLVFPKSLEGFADRRVIGIKYDMVESEIVSDPAEPVSRTKHSPKSKRHTARVVGKSQEKEPPPTPRFSVQIECITRTLVDIEVEAENKEAAREQALQTASNNAKLPKGAEVDFKARQVNRLK